MNVAVVTGAGRGLGREIAMRIARRGLAVLVTDIDEASATETARQLGSPAWAMVQDVRDPASHRAVAAAAAERGRVAVWVNNAGVLRTGTAWGHDEADVRLQVDVNLLGVIWGSRAAVDVMRDDGGQLINIASISALCPAPGLAVYGATKHAVLGFSVSLQGDLDNDGIAIKVSAVCPDAIETDLVRNVAGDEHSSLLFSSAELLRAGDVADVVVGLLDNPRLTVAHPPARAALAHALRPFPETGLRLLRRFAEAGERRRRKRASRSTR